MFEPDHARISARNVILEQLNLEIALRTRIAHAVQAKIDYAEILRDLMVSPEEPDSSRFQENAIQTAALSAYSTIEGWTSFLVPPTPSDINSIPIHSTSNATTKRRALIRKKAHSQNRRTSCLYVQHGFTNPPIVVKLACVDCSRSDFPSIQGLLNHCRLSHRREFSGHDDLVEICGNILSAEERELLISHGMEVKVVNLPSLRAIFERAVTVKEDLQGESLQGRNFLSKTLGVHKDTPDIAPFLGKLAPRRMIHVFDDVQNIDVTEYDSLSSPLIKWKPATRILKQGHTINEIKHELRDLAQERHLIDSSFDKPLRSHLESQYTSTRFHTQRRIVIADRSLWIHPSRRQANMTPYTHQWMISVSSPAYSPHISTFLKVMSITCVSQPPVFLGLQSRHDPPYSCMGVADRPFLARIRLEWAGSKNSPMEIEHWVELDHSRSQRPVLGEEQICDVELDRSTGLLPLRLTNEKMLWIDSTKKKELLAEKPPTEDESAPDIETIMKTLLTEFPLTAEDTKKRHPPRLPYRLVSGASELFLLTYGRRKAIEWRRAQVMADACRQKITPSSESRNLAVGFVYRWLRTCAPANPHRKVQQTLTSSELTSRRFCSSCGMILNSHRPGIQAAGVESGFVCGNSIVKLPLVDISWWTKRQRQRHNQNIARIPLRLGLSRDMVLACDPDLLNGIKRIWRKNHVLPALTADPRSERTLHDKLICLSGPESNLVTLSLLALIVQVYAKRLTRLGLEVLREQTLYGPKPFFDDLMCLMPSHIYRGLLKSAFRGGVNEVIFTANARFGSAEATPT